jgi:proline iminopeptidase
MTDRFVLPSPLIPADTLTVVDAPDLDTILYPPLEPYSTGMLEVGDGQSLYWEESGNPTGKPVVFVHGGPGGGTSPMQRRFFDPARYRIILFDQRQCGRSTPHASTPEADLAVNTTWHLVDDMEKLRVDRGVDRWMVFGGSWGSALALAYAEAHPERVSELVLRGIFTLRQAEIDWYYNDGGASMLNPVWWRRYKAALGDGFSGDCVTAYHRLLNDPDPAVHLPAAIAWTTGETATSTLVEDPESVLDSADPRYALAFARIENHYMANGGFFTAEQLIAGASALNSIPGVIVQGRYDMCCPLTTADALHRQWTTADYRVVMAGHVISEPAIAAELIAATDRFAAA